MKTLFVLVSICWVCLFVSCKKKEEIPPSTIPWVAFKNLTRVRLPANYPINGERDSITIVIQVTDGDKDLGRADHWNDGIPYPPDLYVNLFQKVNGNFKLFDPRSYYSPPFHSNLPQTDPIQVGEIVRMDPTRIKRVSRYTLEITYSLYLFPCLDLSDPEECIWSGDTIRFEMQVLDRAGNKSNVMTTSELVLP